MGSILAAWLSATLPTDLAHAVPSPTERNLVSAAIVAGANPRAYVAEVGPARPIHDADAATERAILAVAQIDFVQGIRLALIVAITLLAMVFAAGLAGFPRGGRSGRRCGARGREPA